MIITNNDSQLMYRKLNALKSISRLSIEQPEFSRWCHNINMMNALEVDQYTVGGRFNLDHYKVDQSMTDLIVPFQVTLKGETTEVDLLATCYKQYNEQTAVEEYGYHVREAVLMNPEDFEMITDAILGAFKKSANLSTVDTLKSIASIEDYRKRDMRKGLTYTMPDGSKGWVPVDLKFNFKKNRYYNEDASFVFHHWWSELLKDLKDGKRQSSGSSEDK